MIINNKIIIAKNILTNYVTRRHSFSMSELSKMIIDKGGVLRISPSMTVHKYVDYLEEKGVIKYQHKNKKYIFTSN